MKKVLSLLAASVVLMILAVLPATASDATMSVSRGTVVVDGVIDEVWAKADRQAIDKLTNGDLKADGLPEDWYAYVSALWDDEYVYFLLELKDDDWVMDNDVPGHWRNDCVYLYIDEMSLAAGTWQDGQYQLALIPEEDMSMLPRNGSAIEDGNVQYAYTLEDDTCIMEVAFKFQYATPAEGFTFMADFQRHDDTEYASRDYCVSWSDEADQDSATSSVWGTLVLGGESGASAEALATAAEKAAAASAVPEMQVNRATITIDGVIDEAWANADRQAIESLTNGERKAEGLPADWYAYASSMWDDEYVYFLFELKDDDWVMDNGDPGHWSNDCIYLYIDEKNLSTDTWQEGQYQFALIPEEGMSLFPRNGTAIPEENVKFAYTLEGDTCIMEFACKFQYVTPAEGGVFLADFQRHDDTEAATRDFCVSWSDKADKDSATSNVWGIMTFAGAAAGETEAPETEAPETEAPETEAPETETPETEAPEVVAPAETEAATADEQPVLAPQTADTILIVVCVMAASGLCYLVMRRNRAF